MAQDQKHLKDGLRVRLSQMQTDPKLIQLLGEKFAPIEETIVILESQLTSKTSGGTSKSNSDQKDLLELYQETYLQLKKQVQEFSELLEITRAQQLSATLRTQPSRTQQPAAVALSAIDKTQTAPPSQINGAGGNPVTPAFNNVGSKTELVGSKAEEVGSIAMETERGRAREKDRERKEYLDNLEALKRAKAEDLYNRIEKHKDFINFFLEIDKVIFRKLASKEDTTAIVQKRNDTIKAIKETCRYAVNVGGPLTMARTNRPESLQMKFIKIVDATAFPSGYWDNSYDVRKNPAALPSTLGISSKS